MNKGKNLKVRLGSLVLQNPVMTASGTAGYGTELARFYDPSLLGAIILKGISLSPWQGNPPPRIAETPCGMINSIGLQNVGLEAFLKEKLPPVMKYGVPVIANILGNTAGQYATLAERLDGAVHGVELNVSCPNVKKGGIAFGVDPKGFTRLVREARRRMKKSILIVKLSPGAQDIAEFARRAEAEGADALSLINTIPAMAIDANTRRPLIKNIIGGLSGPAIKPIALRMVYQASKAVGIPVIGMGGITTGQDAVEFMLAGAAAVAVGTATFLNPMAPVAILEGIRAYMDKHKIKDVSSLTGGLVEG